MCNSRKQQDWRRQKHVVSWHKCDDFPVGNLQALKECISSLTGDPILLAKLKKESNALVNNLWSASTAAFRFSMVVDAILNKEDYNIYREGVMKLLKYDSNKII